MQVDIVRVDNGASTLAIRRWSRPVSGIRNGKHFVVASRETVPVSTLETGRLSRSILYPGR